MKHLLTRGAVVCALSLAVTAAWAQQMSVGTGKKPTTYNAVSVIDPITGLTAPPNPPLAYANAAGSPFTLTSAWVKVATTTAATRGLTIAPVAEADTYDIEVTSVAAGASPPAAAPTVRGTPVGYGETFPAGLPIGDIYLRSATGQTAVVRVGN